MGANAANTIIAVPSKGRPGKTTTHKTFESAVFYVPAIEAESYQNQIPNEVVAVPDEIQGITKTRNWILKENQGKNVLFIDDDIREIGCFEYGQRRNLKKEGHRLEEEFVKAFQICHELGFKIFGVEAGGSKFANHPLQPFSFKGVINGSCMGIIADGSYYFDERFQVKEDYEIALRHYKQIGGFLKLRHFYVRTFHWENEGGCVEYRTDQMEEKAIRLLEQRYPLMVRRGKRKNKHQILISWD